MNLERVVSEVRNHSLLFNHDGDLDQDFEDWLVTLSSRWRSDEVNHRLTYKRPDRPPFVLESPTPPKEASKSLQEEQAYSEVGRHLKVEVDQLNQTELDGLMAELAIIGESTHNPEDQFHEPELQLLKPRPFQAEVYAEFQRFVRYQSPMAALTVTIHGEEDWQQVGQTMKHTTKRRDLIGLLATDLLAVVFPSTPQENDRPKQIREQVTNRFETTEIKTLHLPGDTTTWDDLQSVLSATTPNQQGA